MQTNNIYLSYLLQNQSSPEITINEALEKIDLFSFKIVQDIIEDLPENPQYSSTYICSSSYSEHANSIAVYLQNKGWVFILPKVGWRFFILSNESYLRYTTNGWVVDDGISASVTKQGNTFNGANQLIQLDSSAKLPALDGSNLQNLPQSDWIETDSTSHSFIKNKPALHSVATSGNYDELNNKPYLHTVANTGDYNELINKPTFKNICWTGDYNDLINKPVVANKNYIINGDFQVWQRGDIFDNVNEYTADRWFGYFSTVTKEVPTDEDKNYIGWETKYYARCKVVDIGKYKGIKYKMPIIDQFFGETFTLSFWIKVLANNSNLKLTLTVQTDSKNLLNLYASLADNSAWQKVTRTFTLIRPNQGYNIDTSYIELVVSQRSTTIGADFLIANVKLEHGIVATPFIHRSYQEELRECKYYFERINYDDYSILGHYSNQNSTSASTFINFSSKYRIPTINVSSNNAITMLTDGTSITPTSITLDNISRQSAVINLQSSDLVTGGQVFLEEYIDIDAEV